MVRIVSHGKSLHSSEFHEKKRKVIRRRRILGVVIVIVFVILPILVLRMERLRVTEVEVTGTSILTPEEVVRVVEELISRSYLWVIPKDSLILLPRKEIRNKLLTELPRIKSLELNLIDVKTLNVSISERQPSALYCDQVEGIIQSSDCYFLDEDGFIYASAPSYSGDVYFIYTRSHSVDEPLGQSLLPKEVFVVLVEFVNELENLGVSPKVLEITNQNESQSGKYTLHLVNAGRIFWDSEDSLDLVRSNLESFLISDIVSSNPDFLKQVEYIDLTIPNKVYWVSK